MQGGRGRGRSDTTPLWVHRRGGCVVLVDPGLVLDPSLKHVTPVVTGHRALAPLAIPVPVRVAVVPLVVR